MKRVGLFFITDIPVNLPVMKEFTVEEDCSVCIDSECINTTWIDNDTLVIEACVLINCCQNIENGSVNLFGNHLFLYFEITGEYLCNCVCYRQIKYVISGIPKIDFNITVTPDEMSVLDG